MVLDGRWSVLRYVYLQVRRTALLTSLVSSKVYINKCCDHKFCEDQSNADDKAYSVEDLEFLAFMDKAAKKLDGHYLLPLPWKDSGIFLPFNRSTKRKFERDYSIFAL